jgi:hypothetical protein
VPQSRDRETREQSERADAQQVVPAHGAQHELFGYPRVKRAQRAANT